MSRVRKSIWYLLIGLGVVVTAALSWVAGILEPKDLPTVRGVDLGGVVESYPLLTFLLLLAAAVVIAVLKEFFGRRKEASQKELVEFTPQLRTDLLEVLGARYKRRLEDPREQEVWLELGLKETPQALASDPNLRLVGSGESRPVDRGKPIEDLFDEAGGRLLILGEPGAGKTTLLLRLALTLIERAEEDGSEPVPMVVNLASWARHGGSIREWLVEDALQSQANVEQEELARTLIEDNHLLLLLDGLDEIEETRREDYIAAIKDYVGERPRRVVVCSRTEEYEQSGEQLALQKAVQIEPLEPEQVIRELKAHPKTEGLRAMLRKDDQLRELATTPLNVSVMLLTYGGKPASEVQAETTVERRRVLWDDYVTRMIARMPTEYAPENILKWLSWLATKMRQDDMTRFIPDRMQPSWMEQPSVFEWTWILLRIITPGLITCLSIGLFLGLAEDPTIGVRIGIIAGLSYSLSLVLVLLPVKIFMSDTLSPIEIKLAEQVNWNFGQLFDNWEDLSIVLGGILALGVIIMLVGTLVSELRVGLIAGTAFVFWSTTTTLIMDGRSVSMVEKSPSLGDRLRTSRWAGLVEGLIASLVFALTCSLLGRHVYGLVGGLLLGSVFALSSLSVLEFDLLRLLLVYKRRIPWHYFRFLQEAADLLLLEQDGGAVEFRHLLLRDYFAELTPERIEELSARIERTPPD